MGAPGAAGKDGLPGKDSAASGTRLHAKTLVASDGARTFLGWHDTMLDTDCAFATASDLQLRCLPGITLDPTLQATIVYSDAACTKGVALSLLTSAACHMGQDPKLPYVQIAVAPTCEVVTPVVTVLAVQKEIAVPAGAYWISAGACVAVPTGASGECYAANIVDPTTLVSATVQ